MAETFKDAMEFIWEKIPKTKEGLVHYLPGDIPYLYLNGFVDTDRFGYQDWKSAFADCLQEDGTYLVSKNKFMTFRVFCYQGPVFKPLDPQKVREGEWTDAELQKLYDLSIKPSCALVDDVYWNSIKALKDQGLVKNGNLIVGKTVKTQLAYLIERFPSPRRRLEKEVDRIRKEREKQYRSSTKNHDSSTFVAGKLDSEDKMEKFTKLQKSGSTSSKTPSRTLGESIDIKKLKKPSRTITG